MFRSMPSQRLWGGTFHSLEMTVYFFLGLYPRRWLVGASQVCRGPVVMRAGAGAGPRYKPFSKVPPRTRVGPHRALFLGLARLPAERQINLPARPSPYVRGPAACVTRKRAPGLPPPPPNPQQGAEPAASPTAPAAVTAARPPGGARRGPAAAQVSAPRPLRRGLSLCRAPPSSQGSLRSVRTLRRGEGSGGGAVARGGRHGRHGPASGGVGSGVDFHLAEERRAAGAGVRTRVGAMATRDPFPGWEPWPRGPLVGTVSPCEPGGSQIHTSPRWESCLCGPGWELNPHGPIPGNDLPVLG